MEKNKIKKIAEANTRLKVTLKSLKCFECNHFRSLTHIRKWTSCAGHTILSYSLFLPHRHTLYSQSSEVSWMSWRKKTTFLKLEKTIVQLQTTRLGYISLSFTCVFIWSPRKKRITKNCCVFFCFPIQHTHFIQHSTFVRSIPKSFVWRFFLLRDLVEIIIFSRSLKSSQCEKLRKGLFAKSS